MHMTGNFIGRALAVLALALLLPAQGWAADPDPRLEGRTLDVLVGFSNTGDGARFWNLFSGALRRHLPKTVIRARFDDTARGAKGTSDLFSLPEGSLAVGFVRPPDVAFAQARKLEGVDYDLHQAKWIAGVEEESFVMVARRGLPVEPQALRAAGNSLIMPVSDILATHATVGVLLNAVTGIGAKVVVGFGNSARLKSILAGDADFYTAAADQELQPLFESGDVQALYTIVGEQFPPQVDRSRTLESFLVPGAPQAVVDYIKSARGMGRAFFAPPGVSEEDLKALREAFHAVLIDPEFVAEAASMAVPVAAVEWQLVERQILEILPTDGAKLEQIEHAYACGLAMSEGRLDRCDF